MAYELARMKYEMKRVVHATKHGEQLKEIVPRHAIIGTATIETVNTENSIDQVHLDQVEIPIKELEFLHLMKLSVMRLAHSMNYFEIIITRIIISTTRVSFSEIFRLIIF